MVGLLEGPLQKMGVLDKTVIYLLCDPGRCVDWSIMHLRMERTPIVPTSQRTEMSAWVGSLLERA